MTTLRPPRCASSRRVFLLGGATGLGGLLLPGAIRAAAEAVPTDNPLASLKLAWTEGIRWDHGLDVTRLPGKDIDEKLAHAQAALAAEGGGVAFFPAGTYRFRESVRLLNAVVLRGTDPAPVTRACNEAYAPPTRFEFPKYEFAAEGDGMPVARAFKGILLADPSAASRCGVINIDIHRGHVQFAETEDHRCGSNRFVFGCVLRNAATAETKVPDPAIGQKAWQRFTYRFGAAIHVQARENALVVNNRIPKSGDDNFTMNGYVLLGRKKEQVSLDGVVFDYDNRPGIYANHQNIGGPGGEGPDGTPETHPFGFRRGTVIRDNFVFSTGRCAIGFSGDGVECRGNVVRFVKDVWRPTTGGISVTSGSATNDNRAVEMRGWRWVVDDNDYEVYSNWCSDRVYLINDGEGLMHEDHANSIIRDSVLTNNRGNTYLSLFKTAGIDGLRVEGNEIRLAANRGGAAIFVDANRVYEAFPCRNVSIVKNTVAGGGILIAGSPSERNEVRDNRCDGARQVIRNQAAARLSGNTGFDVDETPWQPRKRR